jgi:hypothetical protein
MRASARPYAIAGSALLTSSMIAVMPAVQPAALRVAKMDVRLVDADSLLTDVTGALGGIDPLSSLSLPDLGSLDLGSLDLGGLANIPYNVFADIVNIPANEINAIGTYAAALGPAGESVVPSVGGLETVYDFPGFTGLPVIEGPVGLDGAYEPLGIAGTGSWWMESIGNTWGWDDGNFAQVDGIANLLVPFPQFSTPVAEELQVLAEAEIVDGAKVNCEFECANVLGYFGNWFQVPLTQLLSGYTFPDVLADSVGMNSPIGTGATGTGVINLPGDTVWSDTSAVLNPLLPLESVAANLTGSPADNPIMLPDPATLITNVINLSNDLNYYDFNPFVTGSFLYWGAPTLYSVPAFLGGIVQDLTGIPNQFANIAGGPGDWQANGAEPFSGYTASLPELVQGLPQGFQYLLTGLLSYVSPTLAADLSGPLSALGNLGTLPADLLSSTGIADLWALLTTALPQGIADLNTQVAAALSTLLGGDPSTAGTLSTDLAGLLDTGTLSADLAGLLDTGTLSTDLTGLLSTALPGAAADLSSLGSMFGTELAGNLPSLLTSLF